MKNKSLLKLLGVIVLAIVVAIPLTVGCAAQAPTPAPAPEEEPINLTYAFYNPPSGLQGEGIMIWIDEIDRYTKGKVQVEPFWSGSLFKGKEMLKGVADGVVDMGRINSAYYTTEMPIHQLWLTIPSGPSDFMDGLEVMSTLFQEFPEFDREFTEYNQRPLFRTRVISSVICSTEPFASFEDFEGKRLRAGPAATLKWLGGAGAVPVSVPWSDCFMALSTGSIEGVYTNLDGIHSTKLDEPASNMFVTRDLSLMLHYYDTINLDSWNKLPNEIQEQLMTASRAAEARYAKLFSAEFDRCIAEQAEMGCVINFWSEEDLDKFISMPIIAELQAEWVKDAEAAGVDDAAQMFERANELIKSVEK